MLCHSATLSPFSLSILLLAVCLPLAVQSGSFVSVLKSLRGNSAESQEDSAWVVVDRLGNSFVEEMEQFKQLSEPETFDIATPYLENDRKIDLYWTQQITIDGVPLSIPLEEVLNLDPLPRRVILFAADMAGTQDDFSAPFFIIKPEMMDAATVEDSEGKTVFDKLHEKNIKILISVLGSWKNGWSEILPENAPKFAQWVSDYVCQELGFDGVDIDDEYGGPGKKRPLHTAVAAAWVHYEFSKVAEESRPLLSKSMWQDLDAFSVEIPEQFAPPGYAGKKLGNFLDMGGTMYYGQLSVDGTGRMVSAYLNAGVSRDRLSVGVAAGNKRYWSQFNTCQDAFDMSQLADRTGLEGMRLWNMQQDTQQFTHAPRNTRMYPDENDFLWFDSISRAYQGEENQCYLNGDDTLDAAEVDEGRTFSVLSGDRSIRPGM